jgi:hypothetical protein
MLPNLSDMLMTTTTPLFLPWLLLAVSLVLLAVRPVLRLSGFWLIQKINGLGGQVLSSS